MSGRGKTSAILRDEQRQSERRPRDEKRWERLYDMENAKLPLRHIQVTSSVMEIARLQQLKEMYDDVEDENGKRHEMFAKTACLLKICNHRTEMSFRQKDYGAYAYGRMYTNNTIISLDQEGKTFLFDGFHQLDIVNSLPTILLHYYSGSIDDLRFLPDYVENREKYLSEYAGDDYELRRVFKKMIISALVTGRKWEIDEFEALSTQDKGKLARFNFAVAMSDGKKMHNQYRLMYDKFFKLQKGTASALSLMHQDIEAHIIERMVFFLERRYPLELQKKIIPAYDAIWFKYDDEKGDSIHDIATEMEEHIAQYFNGLQIRLGISKFQSDIVLTHEHIPEYEDWKLKFEENHFKLLNPVTFCKIDEEGALQMFNRNRFVNEACVEEFTPHVLDWLKDSTSRKHLKLVFAPPPLDSTGCFNMYNGLRASLLEPVPEDQIKELTFRVRQQLFMLGGASEITYEYLANYLAYRVQFPGKLPGVALAFRSVQGTGKDSFFAWFGKKILGDELFYQSPTVDALFGDRFSKATVNRLMVVISEVVRADSTQHINKMKSAITATKKEYRAMNTAPVALDNFCAFVLFGQDHQFLKLDSDDRRFAVFNVYSIYANNSRYFEPLLADYQDDRVAAAFYQYLMARDLSDFVLSRDRPMTSERKNMVLFNVKPFMSFLWSSLDCLWEEFGASAYNPSFHKEKTMKIRKTELKDRYKEWYDDRFPSSQGKMAFKRGFYSDLTAVCNDWRCEEDNKIVEPLREGIVDGISVLFVLVDKVKARLDAELSPTAISTYVPFEAVKDK